MTTRITFVFYLLFLMSLIACQQQSETAIENSQPNLIFILADDLGYGDLGSYGQEVLQTPNLDKMAAEGIRFTQAYAGNTVCSPSRSCLVTGLHPGHAIHRGNYGDYQGVKAYVPFERGTKTIASYLKEQGYNTAHIGKWHLGGNTNDSTSATFLGFDYSYGYFQNYLWTLETKAALRGQIESMYYDTIWRNQELVIIEENLNHGREIHSDDIYTEEALRYLERKHDRPFFLYLAYHTPHAPQDPPSEGPFAKKDWPEVERKFASDVYHLDQRVGKIMDKLKKLKIDKETLVVFSSDNGAHHEGGHDHAYFDSNGPLRGYKRDMYDGGIKVPMIARWPGKIKAGTTSAHICAFWDVLPTFTELAGNKIDEGLDGISFAPTLLGKPDQQEQHEYLYWEIMESGGRQGVRMDKWKAVRYDIDQQGFEAPVQLFDVSMDEGEQNDIAGENPEVVQKVKKIMTAARVPNPYFKFESEKK